MNTHTPEQARVSLIAYGRAMLTSNFSKAIEIEDDWGLYGYPPEIVSTVLSRVATGLPLDAAINKATGETA